MVITSEIKPTHKQITVPIEAWQYTGQPYEEYPDWVRSWIDRVYQGGTLPKPRLNNYALRDDEGYFWRWMRPDQFDRTYERI